MTVNVCTVPRPAVSSHSGSAPHSVHSARGYHCRCPQAGHCWTSRRPSRAACQYSALTLSIACRRHHRALTTWFGALTSCITTSITLPPDITVPKR